MKLISTKSEIKPLISEGMYLLREFGKDDFVKYLNNKILSIKVRFPILEFCANEICTVLPRNQYTDLCLKISASYTLGGLVIIGMLLQKQLDYDFDNGLKHASKFIANYNGWQAADIIGERVFGQALLIRPAKTLDYLWKISKDDNQWVVRSIGPGCHFAIKRGLIISDVDKVLDLLLSLSNSKNNHIKSGIGWAAKATAKFHPDLIIMKQDLIEDEAYVGRWFRAKIKKGLKRNIYANRN